MTIAMITAVKTNGKVEAEKFGEDVCVGSATGSSVAVAYVKVYINGIV
jgi:hypothetical protein